MENDTEHWLNGDDHLDEARTDSNGSFHVSGSQADESGDIDPFLVL